MDALNFHLLNDFQRDFPLVPRPYGALAQALACSEREVLVRLAHLKGLGSVSRVGAVFAPKRIGASTLAAMAVPGAQLAQVAEVVSAFPEVNHNYEREHRYNLWFVVTAPDQALLARALANIEAAAGHALLALPLEEEYHIDLGFCLAGGQAQRSQPGAPLPVVPLDPALRCLVGALQSGLPLSKYPYAELGAQCGLDESQVMAQIASWLDAGIIKRWGVVVRHRELGFTANAMVVHDVPDGHVAQLGRKLAEEPAITLCYRRPRVGEEWPYNLFCMIHGRDRASVQATIADLRQRHQLHEMPFDVLFSRTRFKQTGARYA